MPVLRVPVLILPVWHLLLFKNILLQKLRTSVFFSSDRVFTLCGGNLKPQILRLGAITHMRSYLASTRSRSALGQCCKSGIEECTPMMIIWPCVVYSAPLSVQQPTCVTAA